MSSNPITVGYWSIRGLGAPIRMMIMHAGAPLNAVNYDLKINADGSYDASCWFSVKPELKEKNPLMNLPYIVDGDIIVSQSNACFTYLGRKLNMMGDNEVDAIRCEELLCEIMDLRNKIVQFSYGKHADEAADAKTMLDDVSGKNGIYQKLELCLARNESRGHGTFLVGSRATAPDFHLWEMIDQYNSIAKYYNLDCPVKDFPKLAAFHNQFAALPENEKYFASPLSKLPCNQKMAAFGATRSGDKFVAGQEYDWTETSGVY